jgi:hypothetical protein
MADIGEAALKDALATATTTAKGQADSAEQLTSGAVGNPNVLAAMDAAMSAKNNQRKIDLETERKVTAALDVTWGYMQAALDGKMLLETIHKNITAAQAEQSLSWGDNFFTKLGHELTGNTANAHLTEANRNSQALQAQAVAVRSQEAVIADLQAAEKAKVHTTPEYQLQLQAQIDAEAVSTRNANYFALGKQQLEVGQFKLSAEAEAAKLAEASVRAQRDKIAATDTRRLSAIQLEQHETGLALANLQLDEARAATGGVEVASANLSPTLNMKPDAVRAGLNTLPAHLRQAVVNYGYNPVNSYSLDVAAGLQRLTQSPSDSGKATFGSAATSSLLANQKDESSRFLSSIYDASAKKLNFESADLKAAFGNDDKALAAFAKLPEDAQRMKLEAIAGNRTMQGLAAGKSFWAQDVNIGKAVTSNPGLATPKMQAILATAGSTKEALASLYAHLATNTTEDPNKVIREFSQVYGKLAQLENEGQSRDRLQGAKPVASILASMQMPSGGLLGLNTTTTHINLLDPVAIQANYQALGILKAKTDRLSVDIGTSAY